MENMHPIDNLFREKLRDKENEFQESHWEMLLEELEGDKRRSIIFYWRHAAAIAILAVGGWWLLNNQGTSVQSTSVVAVQKTESAVSPEAGAKAQAAEAFEATEEEKSLAENLSASEAKSDVGINKIASARTIVRNEISDQGAVNARMSNVMDKSLASEMSSNEFLNVDRKNSLEDNRFSSDLNEDAIQAVAVLDESKNAETLAAVKDLVSKPNAEISLNETKSASETKAGIIRSTESLSQIDKLDAPFLELASDEISIQPLVQNVVASKKDRKGFLSIGPGFVIGRSSVRGPSDLPGPESSNEDFFSFDNNFHMAGLDVAYHFNDKLDLSVGAFYGDRRYNINGIDLTLDQDQSVNRVVEVYQGLVDIPISLGYTFGKKHNAVRPFVRAGVSLSAFNGVVKSSVNYSPLVDAIVEITPEPLPESDAMNGGSSFEDGIGTAGSPSMENEMPEMNFMEPEPLFEDVLVNSTYAERVFASNGRLFFDNVVRKLLPLHALASAGLDIRLSERFNLRLSGRYRITRKAKSSLNLGDAQFDGFTNETRLVLDSDGIGSEKGFKDISALISVHYRIR